MQLADPCRLRTKGIHNEFIRRMKEKFETSVYWIGFWKTEHNQDQQNGTAYGQKIASLEQVAILYLSSIFSQNAIFYK